MTGALRNRAAGVRAGQGARELFFLPRIATCGRALFGAGLFAVLALGLSPVKAQDATAGERSFGKCRICHEAGTDAKNRIGPHLSKVFGRVAGSIEGYQYSAANRNSGLVWNEENIAAFIRDPRGNMPGTKMAFAGIKNEKEVLDLVEYLKSQ